MFKRSFNGFKPLKEGRTEQTETHLAGEVRKKYKLSRSKLGYLLDVNPMTIYAWDKGTAKPSTLVMMVLAMMLEGYVIPSHIRDKYMPKHYSTRRNAKLPKHPITLDRYASIQKGDGT